MSGGPTGERVPPRAPITVVVLAGGGSTRFGSDKLAAPLGGTTVLDHLLAGLPPRWPVVLVGPPRPTVRPDATWVQEDPAGGGPLAAVAAALAVVATPRVAVAAGDMPFAAAALPVLTEALVGAGAGTAVVARVGGRENPLLAVYDRDAVRAALPDATGGLPARTLLAVPHVVVDVPEALGRDVDTRADLDALRGGA
jgi:molybdopterin-guanine dinucleotide biosynthesis protein A